MPLTQAQYSQFKKSIESLYTISSQMVDLIQKFTEKYQNNSHPKINQSFMRTIEGASKTLTIIQNLKLESLSKLTFEQFCVHFNESTLTEALNSYTEHNNKISDFVTCLNKIDTIFEKLSLGNNFLVIHNIPRASSNSTSSMLTSASQITSNSSLFALPHASSQTSKEEKQAYNGKAH